MIAIPTDKVLHFAAGTLAATLGVLVVPWLPLPGVGLVAPIWLAGLATAAAAVLREVYNRAKGGAFDWRDILATLAGGAPVLAVTAVLAG